MAHIHSMKENIVVTAPFEPVAAPKIEKLRSSLRGRVLTAFDDEYEVARKIHNGMIDRYPQMIARCRGGRH